ncbi:hypothetical protein ACLB2K_055528 [Fragaria x ananassa]
MELPGKIISLHNLACHFLSPSLPHSLATWEKQIDSSEFHISPKEPTPADPLVSAPVPRIVINSPTAMSL